MRRFRAMQLRQVAEMRDLLAVRAKSEAARAARELREQVAVLEEAEQHFHGCHESWRTAMSDPRLMTDIAAAWAQAVSRQAQVIVQEETRFSKVLEGHEREALSWHRAQLLRDDSHKRSRAASRHAALLTEEEALSEIADRHVVKGARA